MSSINVDKKNKKLDNKTIYKTWDT
jgi:hypothetical protein